MSDATADRDPFEVLAESFLERYRAGELPSIEELTAGHPELADQIRELLPALVIVEQELRIDGDTGRGHSHPVMTGAMWQLGDYRILREIGRGGMGVVYEAEQVSLGRRVALKVLPNQIASDRKALERFRREAKSAARLHHTNIVPVFEVGLDGETAYYAMQFIEGQALDQVIDELARLRGIESKPTSAGSPGRTKADEETGRWEPASGRIAESLLGGRLTAGGAMPSADDVPPASSSGPAGKAVLPGGSQVSTASLSGRWAPFHRGVAQIGRQVAQGLAYAHASGFLHRDIKPSNLLLDQAGVTWIADFGLAKGLDDGLTRTGDILGTIRYMAPERFRGEGDARADVYALGLTLYELLTFRPAFDSSDRLELIEQIKDENPPKLRALDARIPRDLETIVLKAIEKDPKARYQTAEAMGEDLRRFLADEPILARRVGVPERYWRWARRNPGVAALGGVLAAVLVATTLGSLVTASYFRTLARSESRANRNSLEAQQVAVEAQRQAVLQRDKALRNEKAERWGRYRANIAAAPAAMQLQNSDGVRRILDDAPAEHRNWEWRYLKSRQDVASLVLPSPGRMIGALALSPSGRQVAVSYFDSQDVNLYDVATGKLDAVLRGHSAPGNFVAYRPDGKQVATIGNDQTLRLWDPTTGRQTAVLNPEVAPPKPDHHPTLFYNADGSRIATSNQNRSVADIGGGTSRLWDVAAGKELAVLARWRESDRPLAFSPDGRRVAVGSGGDILLSDSATGRRLAVLGPHVEAVHWLAYSPDGRRIAGGESDGDSNAIRLWDGESGKEVAVLRGHVRVGISLLFSPDGTRLVSTGRYPDCTTRLWDAATGHLVATLVGHKNQVWNLAFSPDGARLATSSTDQTARLWDARTGQSLAVLNGHTDDVYHCVFSRDGTRVVTASADSTLRLWNARAGEFIAVLRGHGDCISVLAPAAPVVTPDGQRLVSGSDDGTVRIWDLNLAERSGVLRGHKSYVNDVAFSPDGQQVASAAWDGTVRLWDPDTGLQLSVLKHDTDIVTSVVYGHVGHRLISLEKGRGAFLWNTLPRNPAIDSRFVTPPNEAVRPDGWLSLNPAGTLLAMASIEGPVRLWDVATRREVARLEGHENDSVDAAFHPEGSPLATTGMDGTIRLWDVATHAPIAVLRGHANKVWRVSFNADGSLLASCSEDKTVRLWDTRTRAQLAVIPVGSMVYSVAFSPDGTRLAAACRDNTIRLFDVASRDQVAELRGHTDYVHAVAWSPDGTRLVSGSGDFTIRIWDSLSPAARAALAMRRSPVKPG